MCLRPGRKEDARNFQAWEGRSKYGPDEQEAEEGRGRAPRMYAAKTAGSAAAFSAQESLAGLQSMPLADRAAAAGHNGHRKPSRSAWL